MGGVIERIRITVVGFYSVLALRFFSATWKIECEGVEQLDNRLANGEKLIAVFWHGKYYALLPILRNRNACVFTSISSRGDVIALILRQFGFKDVQIPNHGGELSLNIMRKALRDCSSAAIAVDGPLGPYHVVHRGAVQLASELGHHIVPLSIATDRKRVLENRWDKFEMPRLFAKTVLVVGDPICVPPDLDTESIDQWIGRIHQALVDIDARAETRLVKSQLDGS